MTTFAIFNSLVLKEKPRWVDLGAFSLIFAGVLLSLLTKPASSTNQEVPSPPPAGALAASLNGSSQNASVFVEITTEVGALNKTGGQVLPGDTMNHSSSPVSEVQLADSDSISIKLSPRSQGLSGQGLRKIRVANNNAPS